jgi:hypothetical protein
MIYRLVTKDKIKLKNLAKELAEGLEILTGKYHQHYGRKMSESEDRPVFKLRYVFITSSSEELDVLNPQKEYNSQLTSYVFRIRPITQTTFEIDYHGQDANKLETKIRELSRD